MAALSPWLLFLQNLLPSLLIVLTTEQVFWKLGVLKNFLLNIKGSILCKYFLIFSFRELFPDLAVAIAIPYSFFLHLLIISFIALFEPLLLG